MVSGMTDDEIKVLSRGGHDYRKVYAAFKAATEHVGQPTVILAQTVKGWTIDALEGKNATHQMKKLTTKDLKAFRDRLYLEIPDSALGDAYNPPYYHPGEDSDEIKYLQDRRRELRGYLPERRVRPTIIKLPGDEVYAPLMEPAGEKTKVATTQAFVRLLRDLMRDKEIGHRIVPIAPDEFRTFGMDSMFPTAKIYNPHGQTYESVDRKLLLSYKESEKGQLLHEGISEVGAMGSVIAAGSSYAMHGEPMIPFYIFYSMFGFQRTGDWIWAMADQLARGFLLGATAGRTTLTGEGLQHADGHSPLLASTNPAVVHYDPAFAYEVAHIVKDGLRRMYGHDDPDHPDGEDLIYYITVYNEPVSQPGAPENLDVEALLRGIYHYASAPLEGDQPRAQILVSGVTMTAALKAQRILADEWGVAADIWSVTSWNELRRDALVAEKWNLTHPGEERREPYITGVLDGAPGPVIAVSDYMRAVQDQIAPWVRHTWCSLGTDGFGFADTRAAARRYFLVDAESIVVATLESLARDGLYDASAASEAFDRYRIGDPTAVAGVAQEGAGA
jgi:pyruvate dehydrogenase E1 component